VGGELVDGSRAHLSICDGDDVRWNVGGHVTRLGLDHGEGRQGAAAKVIVHLGGPLQQAGMQVEDVSGVGLATGGATQQQRHLAVGDGLQEEKNTTHGRF